jgi:hypothetical protein
MNSLVRQSPVESSIEAVISAGKGKEVATLSFRMNLEIHLNL